MLVGRAGTPKPILERLNAEMKRIMAAPAMQKRIADMGLIPLDPAPLDETERYIKSEVVKFRGFAHARSARWARNRVGNLGQQRDQAAHVRRAVQRPNELRRLTGALGADHRRGIG